MKEDTEVAWEEVPEAGPENFREGEEELGAKGIGVVIRLRQAKSIERE
jgi:hypothetical protein